MQLVQHHLPETRGTGARNFPGGGRGRRNHTLAAICNRQSAICDARRGRGATGSTRARRLPTICNLRWHRGGGRERAPARCRNRLGGPALRTAAGCSYPGWWPPGDRRSAPGICAASASPAANDYVALAPDQQRRAGARGRSQASKRASRLQQRAEAGAAWRSDAPRRARAKRHVIRAAASGQESTAAASRGLTHAAGWCGSLAQAGRQEQPDLRRRPARAVASRRRWHQPSRPDRGARAPAAASRPHRVAHQRGPVDPQLGQRRDRLGEERAG
jgi:hypothetical protein